MDAIVSAAYEVLTAPSYPSTMRVLAVGACALAAAALSGASSSSTPPALLTYAISRAFELCQQGNRRVAPLAGQILASHRRKAKARPSSRARNLRSLSFLRPSFSLE